MALQGGLIGVSTYQNLVETDRYALFMAARQREGIVSGFVPTRSTTALAMLISAGSAFVQGEAGSSAGHYVAYNTVADTVSWPAAPVANSRIDALVLAVRDAQYGTLPGGTVNGPVWVVVQGTAAVSPVAPTDAAITTAVGPGGWIRVANVTVVVGDTTLQAANIVSVAGTAWQPPFAQVARTSGTQSIPDTTFTAISFNSNTESTPPGFADQANNRLVVPEAGIYHLEAAAHFDVSAGGTSRRIAILVNGVTLARLDAAAVSANGSVATVGRDLRLATGDLVTAQAWQNSGAALLIDTVSVGVYLSARKAW